MTSGGGVSCEECKSLQERYFRLRRDSLEINPNFDLGTRKPRSRWPKAWREVRGSAEKEASLAKANYELHRATVHDDPAFKGALARNLNIVSEKNA